MSLSPPASPASVSTAFSRLSESSEPKPSSMNSVSMTTPPAFCWIVSLMPSARLSAAMKLSPPDRLPTGRVLPV